MKLEIRTEGVEFVVSREPLAKLDNDGRQKADRETGELLYTTELVAMDDSGAEVIKVTTAGVPKVGKRQAVAVRGLVANPWNVDGRGGVAFRADSIAPAHGRCLGRVGEGRRVHRGGWGDDRGGAGGCGRSRSGLRPGRAGTAGSGRGRAGGVRWQCSYAAYQVGLSARAVADQLGLSRPSMTQDVYMGRKIASPAAAEALEGAFDVESDRSVGVRVEAILTATPPEPLTCKGSSPEWT